MVFLHLRPKAGRFEEYSPRGRRPRFIDPECLQVLKVAPRQTGPDVLGRSPGVNRSLRWLFFYHSSHWCHKSSFNCCFHKWKSLKNEWPQLIGCDLHFLLYVWPDRSVCFSFISVKTFSLLDWTLRCIPHAVEPRLVVVSSSVPPELELILWDGLPPAAPTGRDRKKN